MTGDREPAGGASGLVGESLTLDDSLADVISKRTARPLEADLGLRTVRDLLLHLPRRYASRGQLTRLEELREGEHVTVIAEVVAVNEYRMVKRRGQRLEVTVQDGASRLRLTFFNQSWRRNELRVGVRGSFSGKVSAYGDRIQLTHPDYELFPDASGAADPADPARLERWAHELIPIYPASAKVPSWRLRQFILDALARVRERFPDPVPPALREQRGHMPMDDALRMLHGPEDLECVRRAREALRYGEAFVLQAALLQQREAARAHPATPRSHVPGGLLDRFDAALPFELTRDQRRVGDDVACELAGSTPMHRLVQGEVGSGKTVVAVRAMLQTADGGGQSAMLAPTEVLAHQHIRSIRDVLGSELSETLQPVLLTGGMPQAERRRALLRIASGDARIVVGTHALLGEAVSFADLGLVVVDEQHRFGVEQRDALRGKGRVPPHVLVLTATPIPRTVAMTVFGDLDVSAITQLPAGRAGIASHVVPWADRPVWVERLWGRLAEELSAGRQAFFVCPAISRDEQEQLPQDRGREESEQEQLFEYPAAPPGPFGPGPASVETVAGVLEGRPELRGRRIGIVHGRMPADEKDAVMLAFAAGDIDVLVATTVIEVGVNVPNASVMIVADADRFGVSQLHQLRGRVGRGEHAGLCLLMTGALPGSAARERVEAVASTLDGFALAELDLAARREGDVLGTAQSGVRTSLRLLRVTDHGDLIRLARDDAALLLRDDPEFSCWPPLQDELRRLGGDRLEALGRG